MKFNNVEKLPDFEHDIKKLRKKYKTIDDDLGTFISTAIKIHDKENDMGIVRIPGLGFDEPAIYKGRKFACRSLKGKGNRTGIRVIFAHFQTEGKIELIEIIKSEQQNHDKQKIKRHYGSSGS